LRVGAVRARDRVRAVRKLGMLGSLRRAVGEYGGAGRMFRGVYDSLSGSFVAGAVMTVHPHLIWLDRNDSWATRRVT